MPLRFGFLLVLCFVSRWVLVRCRSLRMDLLAKGSLTAGRSLNRLDCRVIWELRLGGRGGMEAKMGSGDAEY